MSAVSRSGRGLETRSSNVARNPPARVSGNSIGSSGIRVGRRIATSPTRNLPSVHAPMSRMPAEAVLFRAGGKIPAYPHRYSAEPGPLSKAKEMLPRGRRYRCRLGITGSRTSRAVAHCTSRPTSRSARTNTPTLHLARCPPFSRRSRDKGRHIGPFMGRYRPRNLHPSDCHT
jgi:hypothetical protein